MDVSVNPIPDVNIMNRSITNFVPVSEEMVSLSEAGFLVDSYWYNQGLVDKNDCYVRKGLVSRLRTAQRYLPKGWSLKIFDAYRPCELQEKIWERVQARIFNSCGGKVSKDTLNRWTSVFEEEPVVDDMDIAPSYMTGGAVGLTIVDSNDDELDMGTRFYEFDSKTWSVYYERRKCTDEEKKIRNNRRLLYNVMMRGGFVNVPAKWWHYDYGDRNWAMMTGKSVCYSGVKDLLVAE